MPVGYRILKRAGVETPMYRSWDIPVREGEESLSPVPLTAQELDAESRRINVRIKRDPVDGSGLGAQWRAGGRLDPFVLGTERAMHDNLATMYWNPTRMIGAGEEVGDPENDNWERWDRPSSKLKQLLQEAGIRSGESAPSGEPGGGYERWDLVKDKYAELRRQAETSRRKR